MSSYYEKKILFTSVPSDKRDWEPLNYIKADGHVQPQEFISKWQKKSIMIYYEVNNANFHEGGQSYLGHISCGVNVSLVSHRYVFSGAILNGRAI